IAQIEEIVHTNGIDAELVWVDGYLHAPIDAGGSDWSADLKEDATLAHDLGFDTEYLKSVPLVGTAGVRFANQARIHPRKYLAGVAQAIVARGGRIYEHSEVDEFCNEPRSLKVNDRTVRCQDVIIATHNPLMGFGGTAGSALFQTKLA